MLQRFDPVLLALAGAACTSVSAPSSRRPGPTPAPLPSFAARSRWCC
ncbi:hypothetical protein ACFQXA_23975 [Nocardiopsis composta]